MWGISSTLWGHWLTQLFIPLLVGWFQLLLGSHVRPKCAASWPPWPCWWHSSNHQSSPISISFNWLHKALTPPSTFWWNNLLEWIPQGAKNQASQCWYPTSHCVLCEPGHWRRHKSDYRSLLALPCSEHSIKRHLMLHESVQSRA